MCGLLDLKLFLILILITSGFSIPIQHYEERNENDNHLIEENLANNEEIDYFDVRNAEFEQFVGNLLEEYYDKYIQPNLNSKDYNNIDSVGKYLLKSSKSKNGASKYSKIFDAFEENEEQMQGDMAYADSTSSDDSLKIILSPNDKTNTSIANLLLNTTKNENVSSNDFSSQRLDREKFKNEMLYNIQAKVLEQTGHTNNTKIGIFDLMNKAKSTQESGQYLEKVRSFYPSCEVPRNTDEDAWKDPNIMNLFFNINYNNGGSNGAANGQSETEDTVYIGSASLRLYRIPQENVTVTTENCQKTDGSNGNEDDKQIRVSIYWYLRSLKKHKTVKRRLADSKMVPMAVVQGSGAAGYVEFNVRPAARSWVRGRNLGLGVSVEDVDGAPLPAAAHFKPLACDTVGTVSTPKPLPSVVVDAVNTKGRERLAGGVGTVASSFSSLLPKLDICTIDLPRNLSGKGHLNIDSSTRICRLLNGSSPPLPLEKMFGNEEEDSYTQSSLRRIRHQHRQDLKNRLMDRKVVLTFAELNERNRRIQSNNNESDDNR